MSEMTAPQEMTRETLEHIRSQWASGSTVIGITFKQLTAIADMALASLSADKVLVPREPTAAMLEAADVAMMTPETPHGGYIRGRSGTRIWKAMLSAAPQPTEDSNER